MSFQRLSVLGLSALAAMLITGASNQAEAGVGDNSYGVTVVTTEGFEDACFEFTEDSSFSFFGFGQFSSTGGLEVEGEYFEIDLLGIFGVWVANSAPPEENEESVNVGVTGFQIGGVRVSGSIEIEDQAPSTFSGQAGCLQ